MFENLDVIDQRPDGSLILQDKFDNVYNVDNITEAFELDASFVSVNADSQGRSYSQTM